MKIDLIMPKRIHVLFRKDMFYFPDKSMAVSGKPILSHISAPAVAQVKAQSVIVEPRRPTNHSICKEGFHPYCPVLFYFIIITITCTPRTKCTARGRLTTMTTRKHSFCHVNDQDMNHCMSTWQLFWAPSIITTPATIFMKVICLITEYQSIQKQIRLLPVALALKISNRLNPSWKHSIHYHFHPSTYHCFPQRPSL